MDIDFWMKFYRTWENEALKGELEACHKFQRNLILRASRGDVKEGEAYNLLVQSQTRENIIRDVIEEKKNG